MTYVGSVLALNPSVIIVQSRAFFRTRTVSLINAKGTSLDLSRSQVNTSDNVRISELTIMGRLQWSHRRVNKRLIMLDIASFHMGWYRIFMVAKALLCIFEDYWSSLWVFHLFSLISSCILLGEVKILSLSHNSGYWASDLLKLVFLSLRK